MTAEDDMTIAIPEAVAESSIDDRVRRGIITETNRVGTTGMLIVASVLALVSFLGIRSCGNGDSKSRDSVTQESTPTPDDQVNKPTIEITEEARNQFFDKIGNITGSDNLEQCLEDAEISDSTINIVIAGYNIGDIVLEPSENNENIYKFDTKADAESKYTTEQREEIGSFNTAFYNCQKTNNISSIASSSGSFSSSDSSSASSGSSSSSSYISSSSLLSEAVSQVSSEFSSQASSVDSTILVTTSPSPITTLQTSTKVDSAPSVSVSQSINKSSSDSNILLSNSQSSSVSGSVSKSGSSSSSWNYSSFRSLSASQSQNISITDSSRDSNINRVLSDASSNEIRVKSQVISFDATNNTLPPDKAGA